MQFEFCGFHDFVCVCVYFEPNLVLLVVGALHIFYHIPNAINFDNITSIVRIPQKSHAQIRETLFDRNFFIKIVELKFTFQYYYYLLIIIIYLISIRLRAPEVTFDWMLRFSF